MMQVFEITRREVEHVMYMMGWDFRDLENRIRETGGMEINPGTVYAAITDSKLSFLASVPVEIRQRLLIERYGARFAPRCPPPPQKQ